MEPISLSQKNGEFVILHRCVKCGFERKNKVATNDNWDVIVKLSIS